jgi:hypothetical protein
MTDEDLIDGVIVDCDWVKSSRLYEDLEPSKKVGSVIKKKGQRPPWKKTWMMFQLYAISVVLLGGDVDSVI